MSEFDQQQPLRQISQRGNRTLRDVAEKAGTSMRIAQRVTKKFIREKQIVIAPRGNNSRPIKKINYELLQFLTHKSTLEHMQSFTLVKRASWLK